MSKDLANVIAPKRASGFSPEEKAWLKKLGTLVGVADAGEGNGGGKGVTEVQPRGIRPAGFKETVLPKDARGLVGDKRELTEGFSPLDIPEIIPKTADSLLGELTATVMINNNSDQDLFLDPQSREDGQDTKALGLSSGEYDDFPPSVIKAGDQSAKFKAKNVPINLVILHPHFKGVTGNVRYFIGADKKTTWTLHFDNPRSPGGNEANAKVEGANAAKFEQTKAKAGGGADAKFLFVLDPKGGQQPPVPPPVPPPTPKPSDVKSSCLITVKNQTELPLSLAEDPGKESGDYRSFPADTVPPGGETSFVFEQTPNSKHEDCKGFLVWEVGSPSTAIWRVEWHNPKGEKNTAQGKADPQTAGFKSISKVGEGDENVPIVFTLSGGPGGDGPGPGPGPKPKEEEDFIPPPGSRQPTLRLRDKNADGWVEYLQRMLNRNLGENTLEVDGSFGPATEKAVRAFQTKLKLQVDGTAGNQTWAALRGEKPEGPSTDGRTPHTFEEKGSQARWEQEPGDALYAAAADELRIFAVNVGEQKIDDFNAHVRVTPPNTKQKVVKVKIGPPVGQTKTGQGDQHVVLLAKFKKNFPALDKNGKIDPKAKIEDYLIEAFFDKELGPDFFKGNPVIV